MTDANRPQCDAKRNSLDSSGKPVSRLSRQAAHHWPILPALNTFGDKIDDRHPFAWWFAFHQVKGLPEKMLAGRAHLEQEWFFTYLMKDESALTPQD